jgi:hypothetical protein
VQPLPVCGADDAVLRPCFNFIIIIIIPSSHSINAIGPAPHIGPAPLLQLEMLLLGLRLPL